MRGGSLERFCREALVCEQLAGKISLRIVCGTGYTDAKIRLDKSTVGKKLR